MIAHHATVLHVMDIALNKAFFTAVGFKVTFEWGNPVSYVVMKAGETSIHLSLADKQHTDSNQTDLYVFVKNIETYYSDLIVKGIKGLSRLENRDYGMKDFDLKSPDGYNLSFGADQ